MKIIVKSKANNNVLITIDNSKDLNDKTIEQLEEMKSESLNEEGELLGYIFSGYLFNEDFYFEIE
jgi:hypothetical protein